MMAAGNDEPLYSPLADDPRMADLVELFVAEMKQRTADLHGRFEGGELEMVGRIAHQIKGAAGSYGFAPLTPLAAAVERAVRGGQPHDKIKQSLDELLQACRRCQAGKATA